MTNSRCNFCGKHTSMHAYVVLDGNKTYWYPACCSDNNCIVQWRPEQVKVTTLLTGAKTLTLRFA